MATAQLNARLDLDLKRQGDATLARFGASATDAIRSLWEFLARANELPSFMSSKHSEPQDAGASARAADEGASLALRLAADKGLSVTLQDMTFGELRDFAFDEMVDEGRYRV